MGPERVRDLPKVTQESEEHPGQTLDPQSWYP